MALFQHSIVQKYLNTQANIETAWQVFQQNFQIKEKQENIRQSKEEQYQEGFLNDLFVSVLGYTLNPNVGYNLITEQKNKKNSKKADGAIIFNENGIEKIVAVIELKGMDTTDLNKIEQQAFNYKNSHNCAYVITSNFQKLRFYIQSNEEYLEFDLFKLKFEDFRLMYLCLALDNIRLDIPLKLKNESLIEEEKITLKLYKEYSNFKTELYHDLVKNNPNHDPVLLFQKTQKLLDRFLFILFAEDKYLLEPNFLYKLIEEWENLKKMRVMISLYDHVKQYFHFLDVGLKDEKGEIFAYNGGLFKHDERLNTLTISDDILKQHLLSLIKYDFNSEVDVNILGHIFENSINELDELKAELNGEQIAKSQTKRKKDGVFYTPKYITHYIVKQTVGVLCENKKQELDILDEYYYSDKKQQAKTKQKHLAKLQQYREWLLQLTICDPACGSGAFLNEALNFLIAEHAYIDELESKLFGGGLVFQEVRNHILENNLFGVDINQESVEIAKLSLWLRTAEPHRKLSNLNHNLQCGNSLIDDPNVAGDKAFNWQQAFPHVFEKGGFDVVIGNPPYVRAELLPTNDLKYYQNNYQVFNGSGDLFSYFYELSFSILKNTGLFGFISNTFDKTTAGETLRNYLKNNKKIIDYIDFTEVQIFSGATTYPVIIIASNNYQDDNIFAYRKIPKFMQNNINIEQVSQTLVAQNSLDNMAWAFNDMKVAKIIETIKKLPTVRELYGKCYRGVITGLNEAFIIDKATKDKLIAEDSHCASIIEPVYEGKDLSKWVNLEIEKYMIGLYPAKKLDIENYPSIKSYFMNFGYERLQQIGGTGHRKKTSNKWFETQDSIGYWQELAKNKIVWSNLQNSNKFSFDTKGYAINAPACLLPTDDKSLLAILNSKIVWKFLTSICVVRSGGYIEVKPQYFEQIPIPPMKSEQKENLTLLTDQMLLLNEQLQLIQSKFVRLLERKFEIELNKALLNWQTLSFKDFIKELGKKKIKLSLADEVEWEEFFLAEQKKALHLTQQIEQTDRTINQLVYELYGLTEEEIALIEQEISS